MTYEEVKHLYKEACDKYDEAEKEFDRIHKNDKEFPLYPVFKEYMKPYATEAKKYRVMMISIQPYTLSPLDDIGDYMTLEQFRENCEYGEFIDYDGFGYLCIGEQQTNIEIYPSDVIKANADVSKFDGVMWYNK